MIKLLKRFVFTWFKSYFRRWWIFTSASFLPRLFKQQQELEIFLSLSDPYSFMLVQALPDLEHRFNVKIKLYLMYENSGKKYAAKMWRPWAIKDANLTAEQYGFTKITQEPTSQSLATGSQLWQLKTKTVANAIDVFKNTWLNAYDEHFSLSTPVMNFQIKNQLKQHNKGHYQSASILFAGEWYLGIERLDHLEHRLTRIDLAKTATTFRYNKHNLQYKSDIQAKHPIEAYVSIRSPYSYIGWLQVKKVAQTYNAPLKIKLILPMLMRGIDVPIEKQRYILFDALREARVKKLAIGRFQDPVGQGVINCYALFPYAEKENKAVDYIDAIFHAVYVDGVDLAKIANVQKICRQLNIDYDAALAYAIGHDWQQLIDTNQKDLESLGFWGVPCFTYDNVACWGQDRLYRIEQEIMKGS